MTSIKKAVIPAAGLGIRFLPATKSQPKEMLTIVDKPAIQYVVEETVASGIKDIIIITGRGKRAIEDHFDHTVELDLYLERTGKKVLLEEMERISHMADIHYIRQKHQHGLADAIACAKDHVGDEPFAVLLGDDIVVSKVPCIKQLMRTYNAHKKASIVALERHDQSDIGRYGVIKGRKVANRTYKVDYMVEKPKPARAPSNLAVVGRYILTPEVFDHIEKLTPGVGHELQLTDALAMMAKKGKVYGYEYQGRRYDIGNKIDYLKANIEIALDREDLGKELKGYLKRY
jgi:UTP--glucose-1-phosphate uridylyltransferase